MHETMLRLTPELRARLRAAAEAGGVAEAALVRGALDDALAWVEGHSPADRPAAVAGLARAGAAPRYRKVSNDTSA